MWHLAACKISIILSFLKWIKHEIIFLSRLWINIANINVPDRIKTIYQFDKPFLDKRKSIFEEYGDFKSMITVRLQKRLGGKINTGLHVLSKAGKSTIRIKSDPSIYMIVLLLPLFG